MAERGEGGKVTSLAVPSGPYDPYRLTVRYQTGGGIVRGDGADWFGPLNPQLPSAPDDVQGRGFDFPSGYNLNIEPRAYEPIKFADLRALADSYDLLRIIYPFSKDQIGQTIYVKLLSFNLWGGGLQQLSDVAASSFILQGPPPPGQVQNLAAQQNGDTVLITWTDLTDFAVKGYDILYGATGGTISSAKLISEASRATSESTVSIPPGTWTIYVQGHDIADQLGPPAAANLIVTNANIPVISAAAAPDWLGARSGFVLHCTGVLLPDSTKLASNLTNAQLFTSFVPNPVSSPTYTTPLQDAGFNDELRVFFTDAVAPGPGVAGSASVSFSLDSWADGGSDPGLYASWPAAANADARYYKGRLTQNTSVPSVVAQFTLVGDVAAASLQTVQGFAVGAGGTVLSFATAGVGPFHSPPAITVSPADGILTSAGASSITASSAFIQGFIGSALAAGTVNIFISGS